MYRPTRQIRVFAFLPVLTEIRPGVFQRLCFTWVYKQQELHVSIDHSYPSPLKCERWITVKHTLQEQELSTVALFI
jgi:hypothetical protein